MTRVSKEEKMIERAREGKFAYEKLEGSVSQERKTGEGR